VQLSPEETAMFYTRYLLNRVKYDLPTIYFAFAMEDRHKVLEIKPRFEAELRRQGCKARVKCPAEYRDNLDWSEKQGSLRYWMRNWVGASDALALYITPHSKGKISSAKDELYCIGTELMAAHERIRRQGRTPIVPLYDSSTAPSRIFNIETPEGLRTAATPFADFFRKKSR
jgi:hypothetical protein